MYSKIGNPIIPGGYVQNQQAQPPASSSGATNRIAIVGTATDGVPNQPTNFTNAASGTSKFGTGTQLPYSLMREALSAMPEGSSFVGVRVTDGTETSATISIFDGAQSPAVVATLVAQRPGTNANAGTALVTLRSGSPTASPIYRVTLTYPGVGTETFDGVIAYQVVGGPYVASVFLANLLAKMNGTSPGSTASANWVASQGSSIAAPAVGTIFTASGGTDGAAGVGSAQLLGAPGSGGSRTGMYALGGTGFDFLILAFNSDPSVIADQNAFCESEGSGFGMFAYPQGSSPAQMVAMKTANSLLDPLLIDCGLWDYVFDQYAGASLWVSPMGKIAGIISSLDPEDDPVNKPETGASGVSQTEATIGQGLDSDDQALLVSNSIMYLAKPIPRGNVFGLPHGQASDGSDIASTRMQIEVDQDIRALLGFYVGLNQTTPPSNDPDASPDPDTTRTGLRNAALSLGAQYVSGLRLQSFSAVCDKTNNTRATVLAKKIILNVNGETMAGISFAIAYVAVGSTINATGS